MDDEPPGVPEWVVTYGDMMSLLLTFFIMLVSLSEVVADKKFRSILEAITKKFGYRHGPIAPPGRSFPLNAMLGNLVTLGSFTDDENGRGGVKKPSVPGEDFHSLRPREGDGLPVGDPVPFQPGTVEPVEDFERNLAEIARRLAGIPNKVEIRGIRPESITPADAGFAGTYYQRARVVQRFLETHRVAPERIRLVVAGDGHSLADDDGRVRTPDRVEVYVLDTHVHELIGPRVDDVARRRSGFTR